MKVQTKITIAVLAVGFVLLVGRTIKTVIVDAQLSTIKVQSPASFKSQAADDLLHEAVQQDLVNYEALKKSGKLAAIIEELKVTSPDRMASNNDQLAFWINACNLFVMQTVLDKYPISSAKSLRKAFSTTPFVVGGKSYTIQDIFGTKITPLAVQSEPLAEFLVCQGAIGHPALQNHLITGEGLTKDAESAAYKFVNDPKNVYYDGISNTEKISPYFEWIHESYKRKYETPYDLVGKILARRIEDNTSLKRSTTARFDWRLNDLRFATK